MRSKRTTAEEMARPIVDHLLYTTPATGIIHLQWPVSPLGLGTRAGRCHHNGIGCHWPLTHDPTPSRSRFCSLARAEKMAGQTPKYRHVTNSFATTSTATTTFLQTIRAYIHHLLTIEKWSVTFWQYRQSINWAIRVLATEHNTQSFTTIQINTLRELQVMRLSCSSTSAIVFLCIASHVFDKTFARRYCQSSFRVVTLSR